MRHLKDLPFQLPNEIVLEIKSTLLAQNLTAPKLIKSFVQYTLADHFHLFYQNSLESQK